MHQVALIDGQSLSDFSVQEYGCLEGITQLVIDNPNISAFEEVLKPGTKLWVQDVVPVFNQNNVALAAYFAQNNLEVSTGVKPNILVTPHGIPIITPRGTPIATHTRP